MNPNPFEFNAQTPQKVREVIQALYENKHRARIAYGDTQTGRDWMEEYDTMGTIGKSTGSRPIPLLINNARSLGGGGLLDSSIVKVLDLETRRVLYQHPRYHQAKVTIGPSDLPDYGGNVYFDGELQARCKTFTQAARLADFYRWHSHRK